MIVYFVTICVNTFINSSIGMISCGEDKMNSNMIEEVDAVWYWVLDQDKKDIPQLCLPRNRTG